MAGFIMQQNLTVSNNGTKLRVMVVTDSSDFREEITSALRDVDIEAVAADNKESCLQILSEARDVAVIIDGDMASLDGWAISAQIRKGSDISIILIGRGDPEIAWMKAAEGAIDCFMTPPFGSHEIAARVKSLLRRNETPLIGPTS